MQSPVISQPCSEIIIKCMFLKFNRGRIAQSETCKGVSIHWTGLLGWITGLDYWTRKFLDTAHKRVMQIISLVYVDHAITYERVLAYLC